MSLVKQLKEAGQEDAANKLAISIAAHFPLTEGFTVPFILRDLHKLNAMDAVDLLAERAAQHAPYAFNIPDLIEALHDVGASPFASTGPGESCGHAETENLIPR